MRNSKRLRLAEMLVSIAILGILGSTFGYLVSLQNREAQSLKQVLEISELTTRLEVLLNNDATCTAYLKTSRSLSPNRLLNLSSATATAPSVDVLEFPDLLTMSLGQQLDSGLKVAAIKMKSMHPMGRAPGSDIVATVEISFENNSSSGEHRPVIMTRTFKSTGSLHALQITGCGGTDANGRTTRMAAQ